MSATGSAIPSNPRIVIIGAGICGAATAYFLARGGEADVIVLEGEAALRRAEKKDPERSKPERRAAALDRSAHLFLA